MEDVSFEFLESNGRDWIKIVFNIPKSFIEYASRSVQFHKIKCIGICAFLCAETLEGKPLDCSYFSIYVILSSAQHILAIVIVADIIKQIDENEKLCYFGCFYY